MCRRSRESGVPGYAVVGWYGWLYPAGTPQAIVDKTNAALKEVLSRPAIREQLVKVGAVVHVSTPAEFGKHIADEVGEMGSLSARKPEFRSNRRRNFRTLKLKEENMADQLNVLVICGSLRKGSYNAALTRALPALAPPEMKLIAAPTIASFPLYNADVQESSGFPAPARRAGGRDPRRRRRAVRHAGIQLVDAGRLKNAIDWVSRMKNQPFEDKPVAIQSCSHGPLGGARMQYHWRMSMTFLEGATSSARRKCSSATRRARSTRRRSS